MPELKVLLADGETPEAAEEFIFKAFSAQRDGSIHQEEFHDPAMRDVLVRLQLMHEKQFQAMMNEIGQILDSEYQDNGEL
jgi:hypothetical protein